MKQRFKGEILTTTKTVNKILKMYKQSSNKEGLNWYEEANSFANAQAMMFLNKDANEFINSSNESFNLKINKVAGVIAALSPLKSWTENKRITISFLKEGKSYHTKAMTNKAKAILECDGELETIADILNGSKIVNFFLNIANPDSAGVTIDRHAIALAVGRDLQGSSLQISETQYQFFANCYTIAAKKLGLKPLQVQAVTWVEWRKFKKQ